LEAFPLRTANSKYSEEFHNRRDSPSNTRE
jgi:hypothetical protein